MREPRNDDGPDPDPDPQITVEGGIRGGPWRHPLIVSAAVFLTGAVALILASSLVAADLRRPILIAELLGTTSLLHYVLSVGVLGHTFAKRQDQPRQDARFFVAASWILFVAAINPWYEAIPSFFIALIAAMTAWVIHVRWLTHAFATLEARRTLGRGLHIGMLFLLVGWVIGIPVAALAWGDVAGWSLPVRMLLHGAWLIPLTAKLLEKIPWRRTERMLTLMCGAVATALLVSVASYQAAMDRWWWDLDPFAAWTFVAGAGGWLATLIALAIGVRRLATEPRLPRPSPRPLALRTHS